MPSNTAHLKQIVTYTFSAVADFLEAERLKVQHRTGQRVTMSAHVHRILQRHMIRHTPRAK